MKMREPREVEALIERVRLTAPPQMLEAVRWLVWKLMAGGKKARKVPYYADTGTPRVGVLDSEADQKHFATFEQACARLLDGDYDGLGFALGPDGTGNHWQGVDFDGSTERAMALLELYPTFNDISPSGKGAHLYGYGKAFNTLGENGTGIECYSHGRFFTVTGSVLAGTGDALIDISSLYPTLAEAHSPHVERDDNVIRDKHTGAFTVNERTLAELRLALEFISPDDYHQWVRIGHALRTVGAYDLWVEWSKKSRKWREHDAKKWTTFKPDRVSYKTVFWVAQEAGWKNVTLVEEAPTIRSRLDFRALAKTEPTTPRFIVERWLPANAVTLLASHGSAGKSQIALVLAVCVATGAPFMGIGSEVRRVFVYSCEDATPVLHWRISKICAALGIDMESLDGKLIVEDSTEAMNVMYDENVDYTRRLTQAYTHVNEVVRDEEIDLVIIDNASDVYGANEIHRASVRDFITSLKRLTAHRPDSAVLLLGHASRAAAHAQKKGALYSGSTAWHNSVRSRWELSVENIEDDEPAGDRRRILRCAKSNYGPEGHSYGWYWNPEHQVLLPEEPKSPTENRILRDREDKLLLRALMAVIDGGGRVTVNTTGNNNVRKALEAAEPDLAKRKTADVDLALRRLMLVKPRLVETIELKGRNGTLYEYWAVTDAGRLHASS